MRVKLSVLTCMMGLQGAAFASCQGLVQQQNDALKTAAAMFPDGQSIFTVVTCREKAPSIFEVLYTQLHEREKHLHNAPSGGLSKLKFPIDPNGRSRSTGIVIAEQEEPGSYTLKLRTRTASGDALDISKTVPLAEGQSSVFSEHGITVGFSRLASK